MRDRKLVGSRQRSLSSPFSLPRRERPLLAGKQKTKLHVLNFGWRKDNRELPHYLVSMYMYLNVSQYSN